MKRPKNKNHNAKADAKKIRQIAKTISLGLDYGKTSAMNAVATLSYRYKPGDIVSYTGFLPHLKATTMLIMEQTYTEPDPYFGMCEKAYKIHVFENNQTTTIIAGTLERDSKKKRLNKTAKILYGIK